jgi:hypothetical protein
LLEKDGTEIIFKNESPDRDGIDLDSNSFGSDSQGDSGGSEE